MVERVKTGIRGLDELIAGGIPKGSAVLVAGGSGTGKTILCMQFIYEGAKQKEPGIFVTLESNLSNIVWDMASFNWDIKPLQDKGLVKIYRINADSSGEYGKQRVMEELRAITALARQMGAKRLVIDSLTALEVWVRTESELRSILFRFTEELKETGCTALLVSDTKGGKTDYSSFGVEEFICDGIIALYFTPPNRSIFIRKMRGTDHSKTVHPMEITGSGIEVKPKDEVMWDSVR